MANTNSGPHCCLGLVVLVIGTIDILVGMLKITFILSCFFLVRSKDTRIKIAFWLWEVMGICVYAYQTFIGTILFLSVATCGDLSRRHHRCKTWLSGSMNLIKVLVLEFFAGFLPLTMLVTLNHIIAFGIYLITKLLFRSLACKFVQFYIEGLCSRRDRGDTVPMSPQAHIPVTPSLTPSEEAPPPAYDDLFPAKDNNADANEDLEVRESV